MDKGPENVKNKINRKPSSILRIDSTKPRRASGGSVEFNVEPEGDEVSTYLALREIRSSLTLISKKISCIILQKYKHSKSCQLFKKTLYFVMTTW
jgi:hypothetical protein